MAHRPRVFVQPAAPAARGRRPGRALMLWGAAAAMALAGCQLLADSDSNAVNGVASVENPALARRCGLDAVLVLDASASVRNWNNPPDGNGAIDLVAGAATAFLNAVENTGTRVSIVSYNGNPIAQLGLTDVNTASLAPGGAHSVAIGNPGGPTGPVPPTTGYSQHARAGAGTNWEAGLLRARAMLDSARPGVPRLVVHVSDGRPTRHLDPSGRVTEEGGLAQHVAEAAAEADLLKERGVHIYAVGIGRAPEYLPELQATSGPDVFDQSAAGDVFDPANDDVILATDFPSLQELLRDVAGELCGASLTITKEASTLAAPDQYAPASDWVFTARPEASGGFDWLLPDASASSQKTAVTDGRGRVQFQWDVFDEQAWASGLVTIIETPQEGFTIQAEAACVRTNGDTTEEFTAAVDVASTSLEVAINPGDTVTCVVRNRAGSESPPPPPPPPPAAAIEVVKTASASELPEPGGPVTFTFVVRETTGLAAVVIDTLSDSIYGNLAGQGDCAVPQLIAAGGSYTCSITVNVTGNAGFTETNVVTASGRDEHGNPVSDTDDETVTIGDLPPDFDMCKGIEPGWVPPEGGQVTLTVYIFNDSRHPDPVSIRSIMDSRFGELLDPANPHVIDGYCRSTLDPGGSYGCAYTVFMPGGAPGDVHHDTVVVEAADDEGNVVTATYESSVEVVASGEIGSPGPH
jgi:Mg-chelatase subunit ChlD